MPGAPPRGLEERLRDTRARLGNDVGPRVAASGAADGVHLIPLAFLWDGTAFPVPTPRASVTSRDLPADDRVRLSLGPTRDAVLVDGTAEPVGIAALGAGTGDAFAAKTRFDPRRLDEPYPYFLVRPRHVRARPEADGPRGRTLMRDGRRLGRPHAADWPA